MRKKIIKYVVWPKYLFYELLTVSLQSFDDIDEEIQYSSVILIRNIIQATEIRCDMILLAAICHDSLRARDNCFSLLQNLIILQLCLQLFADSNLKSSSKPYFSLIYYVTQLNCILKSRIAFNIWLKIVLVTNSKTSQNGFLNLRLYLSTAKLQNLQKIAIQWIALFNLRTTDPCHAC